MLVFSVIVAGTAGTRYYLFSDTGNAITIEQGAAVHARHRLIFTRLRL